MHRKTFMRKKEKQKSIALQQIEALFEQADMIFKKDKSLANRYVELARSISMKFKVAIPSYLKRRFCHRCHSYLLPGQNLTVRARNNKIIYHCNECKHMMRFHHK